MEANIYQNGLIYTIKTDTGLYVGSTCDFTTRKIRHKCSIYNENSKKYNLKVYQNIRENEGVYSIEIYKLFPCNSDEELRMEEENVRKYLNANLNKNRSYMTKEDLLQDKRKLNKKYREENKDKLNEKNKKYHEKNKEKINEKKAEIITCECGCQIRRGGISKHQKSKKHLKLMEQLKL